jgi:hypothetical protein
VPELVLLSFSRSEFARANKLALQGDEAAIQQIESVWDEYQGRSLACFLCNHETAHPPFTMMLPDPVQERAKLIGAPLCSACRDLPAMVRWGRCLKLLTKMEKARSGRQLHFNLVGQQRHRHP